MNFDFKSLLSFEKNYGKKLVSVVYYVMAIVIAVNVVVSFISGIVNVATGAVMAGLGQIIFCVPLAIAYLLVLRLICELLNAIFDHCEK